MQKLTIIIALAALLIPACNLIVSIFNYRRDKSNIRTWSRIEWHPYGYAPQTETPVMRISVANMGRRPASILNLVSRAKGAQWSRSLKQPEIGKTGVLDVREYVEEFHQASVAQSLAVKLAEGEVFDVLFRLEDFPNEFIGAHEECPKIAERLFVESVSGTLFPVTGARKHLKQLYSEWSQIATGSKIPLKS